MLIPDPFTDQSIRFITDSSNHLTLQFSNIYKTKSSLLKKSFFWSLKPKVLISLVCKKIGHSYLLMINSLLNIMRLVPQALNWCF